MLQPYARSWLAGLAQQTSQKWHERPETPWLLERIVSLWRAGVRSGLKICLISTFRYIRPLTSPTDRLVFLQVCRLLDQCWLYITYQDWQIWIALWASRLLVAEGLPFIGYATNASPLTMGHASWTCPPVKSATVQRRAVWLRATKYSRDLLNFDGQFVLLACQLIWWRTSDMPLFQICVTCLSCPLMIPFAAAVGLECLCSCLQSKEGAGDSKQLVHPSSRAESSL